MMGGLTLARLKPLGLFFEEFGDRCLNRQPLLVSVPSNRLLSRPTCVSAHCTLGNEDSKKVLSEGLRFNSEEKTFVEERVSQEFFVRLQVPKRTLFGRKRSSRIAESRGVKKIVI